MNKKPKHNNTRELIKKITFCRFFEMEKITYMPKPEWVKGDAIKECLIKAHEPNRAKGIVMQNQFMSAEEFDVYLKNAYCFVALKDNRVIGTMVFKILKCNKWWAKGQDVIYNCMDAICPEYQGTDVYLELRSLREKYIKKTGLRIIQSLTAENNYLIQKISAKMGGKLVRFVASSETDYYSVVMVRWLDGCPFSDRYCNFRYKLSEFIVKTIWKPGRIIRFLPLRDGDYKKLFDHYQMQSDLVRAEDYCKKMGVNYKRFIKWGKKHNKL